MDRKALALVFVGLLVATTVRAGVVPGRWEKVQAERPGTEMIITLTAGDEIRGAYQEVGKDEIFVTVNGTQRTLPKSGIAKITTEERRTGPLWNGPLIGGAIGGSLAAIGVAAYGGDSDWVFIPVWAAIGAGIGLGIDAAVQSRITLYKAPGVD